MIRGTCDACSKSLRLDADPVLMDRDGRSYHFTCWGQQMDAKLQAQRERSVAHKKKRSAHAKKRGSVEAGGI